MGSTEQLNRFLKKMTLLSGEVNSGKTGKTLEILYMFLQDGQGTDIIVLDLAPERVGNVGGKMKLPPYFNGIYLTDSISAPRLSGKNERQIQDLAKKNAAIIESLFRKALTHPQKILFINDATLYLQAGNFTIFSTFLEKFSTVIINAYYGKSFLDSPLSRQEKKWTKALMKMVDRSIICYPYK